MTRSNDSINLQSAGTLSPDSNSTMSPGTKSCALISVSRPSLSTFAFGALSVTNELIARSALFSIKNPKPTVMNTTAKIAIDSRTLPKEYDSIDAVISNTMGRFLNCRKRIFAVERCSTLGMIFCPYFWRLALTSGDERPFSTSDFNFKTASEARMECQWLSDRWSSTIDKFLLVYY